MRNALFKLCMIWKMKRRGMAARTPRENSGGFDSVESFDEKDKDFMERTMQYVSSGSRRVAQLIAERDEALRNLSDAQAKICYLTSQNRFLQSAYQTLASDPSTTKPPQNLPEQLPSSSHYSSPKPHWWMDGSESSGMEDTKPSIKRVRAATPHKPTHTKRKKNPPPELEYHDEYQPKTGQRVAPVPARIPAGLSPGDLVAVFFGEEYNRWFEGEITAVVTNAKGRRCNVSVEYEDGVFSHYFSRENYGSKAMWVQLENER